MCNFHLFLSSIVEFFAKRFFECFFGLSLHNLCSLKQMISTLGLSPL